MQTVKAELTQEISDKYEEDWKVILNTGGNYKLSKTQAQILQQAIATGNRGIVMFQTFSISIPYIAEFYRERRYLKGIHQLSAKASEEPYKPVSKEKWAEFMKTVYKKVGKFPKTTT